MGSVFAMQVRTGYEIKAKEMLKHVLLKTNDTSVKKIYALERKTFLDPATVDSDVISNEDISNYLVKEQLNSSIANKRLQLGTIARYENDEFNTLKNNYKKEINQMQKDVSSLRKKTKIYSVLHGYILIELKSTVKYLPDFLLNIIKGVPLILKVLSVNPIPTDEINKFFEKIKDVLVPHTEIKIDNEIETEIRNKIKSKEMTPKEKVKQIIELEERRLSIVEKMKSILQNKKDKPTTSILQKINLFIKRKRATVSMPSNLLKQLYTNDELKFISERITSKDFLFRLERLASKGRRMCET